MKVDLSPNTMIHSQYHLLSGDIQPHKALSYPSLLTFRLQPRLNLKEISLAALTYWLFCNSSIILFDTLSLSRFEVHGHNTCSTGTVSA